MNCGDLQDVYELHALGLLEGEEKDQADAHLARGCPACHARLNDALAINAVLLASSAPEMHPPASLKRRILAGAGIRSSGWGWTAALAALCMLMLALWLSVEERLRTNELAHSRAELLQVVDDRDRILRALSFLNQPETRPLGRQPDGLNEGQPPAPRASVFVNPRRGVLLICSHLPRLDSGRIFEMWLIPRGGTPRPAGLFQPNPDGTAEHLLPGALDLSALDRVAVTVEPEGGSPGPTSKPILAAPGAGL